MTNNNRELLTVLLSQKSKRKKESPLGFGERAKVSLGSTPEDKIDIILKNHPDAVVLNLERYGIPAPRNESVFQTVEKENGELIYSGLAYIKEEKEKDSATDKMTSYSTIAPIDPAFDLSEPSSWEGADVADHAREVFPTVLSMLGGAMAGTGGFVASKGNPRVTYAAKTAGEGLGASTGEALNQQLARFSGAKNIDPEAIALEGGAGLIGGPFFDAIGGGLRWGKRKLFPGGVTGPKEIAEFGGKELADATPMYTTVEQRPLFGVDLDKASSTIGQQRRNREDIEIPFFKAQEGFKDKMLETVPGDVLPEGEVAKIAAKAAEESTQKRAKVVGKLFEDLREKIPAQQPVAATGTKEKVSELKASINRGATQESPSDFEMFKKLYNYVDGLERDVEKIKTFAELDDFRKRWGEVIGSDDMLVPVRRLGIEAQLRGVYAGVKQDLDKVYDAAGGATEEALERVAKETLDERERSLLESVSNAAKATVEERIEKEGVDRTFQSRVDPKALPASEVAKEAAIPPLDEAANVKLAADKAFNAFEKLKSLDVGNVKNALKGSDTDNYLNMLKASNVDGVKRILEKIGAEASVKKEAGEQMLKFGAEEGSSSALNSTRKLVIADIFESSKKDSQLSTEPQGYLGKDLKTAIGKYKKGALSLILGEKTVKDLTLFADLLADESIKKGRLLGASKEGGILLGQRSVFNPMFYVDLLSKLALYNRYLMRQIRDPVKKKRLLGDYPLAWEGPQQENLSILGKISQALKSPTGRIAVREGFDSTKDEE